MLRHVSQIGTKSAPFADEYKDPRWFERSREAISKHPHCHSCRRSDVKLHVHHPEYAKGKHLWEYPDSSLVVLCESCHELITEALRSIRRTLSFSNASNAAKIALCLEAQLRKEGELRIIERLTR